MKRFVLYCFRAYRLMLGVVPCTYCGATASYIGIAPEVFRERYDFLPPDEHTSLCNECHNAATRPTTDGRKE